MKDPLDWISEAADPVDWVLRALIVIVAVLAVIAAGSFILVALMQWAPWLGVTALGVCLRFESSFLSTTITRPVESEACFASTATQVWANWRIILIACLLTWASPHQSLYKLHKEQTSDRNLPPSWWTLGV